MTAFEDYRTKVLKRRGKKSFGITHSWGVKAAWHAVRKMGVEVRRADFLHIIRAVNMALVGKLL